MSGTYPGYQLPRGTYGWKPSTRTVNGGPGWAAAPKPLLPKPQPSLARKIERRVEKLFNRGYEAVVPFVKERAAALGNAISSIIYAHFYLVLAALGFVGCWKNRERLAAITKIKILP